MKTLLAIFSIGGALLAAPLFLVRVPLFAAETAAENLPVPGGVRGRLDSFVKATGVVKPCVGAEVRVGSRASGVVEHLYVKVGDAVKKGQLLAELDARDLVARRNQASAELRRAQAELLFARSDLQRKRELLTAAVITPSEMDVAERGCSVAEQQVEVAQAALTFATTQLDYARIISPITGVVASVSTQEGETVSATLATPTFVTLIDLSRLEVWAYVDETDIGRIRTGQKATFTVDTYGEEEFPGRVTTIYPKAEIRDNVVDYVTVVEFEARPDRVLRPEMTTTVRIALDSRAATSGAKGSL
jgi:RND family efflux transporter MFP subunit